MAIVVMSCVISIVLLFLFCGYAYCVVWASVANIPTNMMDMVSRCTSLFCMCVGSCAITVSSSSSSGLFIIP